MNMCTVREIREAIQEDCRSQRDMESTEIDRVFQTLPFSQERDLFDKPPMPKRPYLSYVCSKRIGRSKAIWRWVALARRHFYASSLTV